MDDPPEDVAEGWKPYPKDPKRQRYWDGKSWTDQFAPRSRQQPPKPEVEVAAVGKKDDSNEIVVGWVLAIILPLFGFFYGLALMIRNEERGWQIATLSAVLTVVYPAIVFGTSGS